MQIATAGREKTRMRKSGRPELGCKRDFENANRNGTVRKSFVRKSGRLELVRKRDLKTPIATAR